MWFFKLKNKLLKIANKKTPLYVYNTDVIREEIKKYKIVFKNVELFYALKANSNLDVCRFISSHGLGAEVVSGGELLRAKKAGFKKIIFSGVGKGEDEIEIAIKDNIFFINIESYEEFEKISKLSRRLKIRANISVRINPDIGVDSHYYIVTSKKYSKFGVDFNTALEIYKRAKKEKYINIRAIHFHLGSQIFSSLPYKKALNKVLKFLDKLKLYGIVIETIDIGGGWGVKEGMMTKNHKELYSVIKPYINRFSFIIEPGRTIVASCGVLLTKVLYRKKIDNKYIVIVDAGMNDLIRPALYSVYHPIYNINKSNGSKVKLDIAGPICESSDFFAKDIKMALPKQGDVLAIASTGAYGYSMSSNYNFRQKPQEILIRS